MFSVYEPLYLNQCGSEQGFHDVLCDEINDNPRSPKNKHIALAKIYKFLFNKSQ